MTRSFLTFCLVFLSACAGEIAAGEDLKLFRSSMASELGCGYKGGVPCDIVGGGSAEKGSIELYNCRAQTIWDREQNSFTQYTIYGRGGSMFDNQATYNVMDINLPKADPEMVALIEQAERLGCRGMTREETCRVRHGDNYLFQACIEMGRFEFEDTACSFSTCIATTDGDKVIITKRP